MLHVARAMHGRSGWGRSWGRAECSPRCHVLRRQSLCLLSAKAGQLPSTHPARATQLPTTYSIRFGMRSEHRLRRARPRTVGSAEQGRAGQSGAWERGHGGVGMGGHAVRCLPRRPQPQLQIETSCSSFTAASPMPLEYACGSPPPPPKERRRTCVAAVLMQLIDCQQRQVGRGGGIVCNIQIEHLLEHHVLGREVRG